MGEAELGNTLDTDGLIMNGDPARCVIRMEELLSGRILHGVASSHGRPEEGYNEAPPEIWYSS